MSNSDAYSDLPDDQFDIESEQAYGATTQLILGFDNHAPTTHSTQRVRTDGYDQPWTQSLSPTEQKPEHIGYSANLGGATTLSLDSILTKKNGTGNPALTLPGSITSVAAHTAEPVHTALLAPPLSPTVEVLSEETVKPMNSVAETQKLESDPAGTVLPEAAIGQQNTNKRPEPVTAPVKQSGKTVKPPAQPVATLADIQQLAYDQHQVLRQLTTAVEALRQAQNAPKPAPIVSAPVSIDIAAITQSLKETTQSVSQAHFDSIAAQLDALRGNPAYITRKLFMGVAGVACFFVLLCGWLVAVVWQQHTQLGIYSANFLKYEYLRNRATAPGGSFYYPVYENIEAWEARPEFDAEFERIRAFKEKSSSALPATAEESAQGATKKKKK